MTSDRSSREPRKFCDIFTTRSLSIIPLYYVYYVLMIPKNRVAA